METLPSTQMAQTEITELLNQLNTKEKLEITNFEQILQLNEFTSNERLLLIEIGEVDSFYGTLKADLISKMDPPNDPNAQAKPTRMGTKEPSRLGSSRFVTDQTANLISMKQLKLAMLKQRTDLKHAYLDRAMKVVEKILKERENNKDSGGINGNLLLRYLLSLAEGNNGKGTSFTGPNSERVIDGEVIEPVEDDSALEARLNEVPSDKFNASMDELVGNIKPSVGVALDNLRLVYSEGNEAFYLIDEEDTIIEEIPKESVDLVVLDADTPEERYYDNVLKKVVIVTE